MRSELLELAAISPRDIAEWRSLARRSIEPNPFHEPEYLLPLARGLGREDEVRLLVVRDGAEWQACLPVRLGLWHGIPAPAIWTWQANDLYSLLGTPLVSRLAPHEAMAALLRGVLGGHRVTFAVLAWMSDDGPLARVLAELTSARERPAFSHQRFERATLERRAEDDYVEDTLSPKHRRELRRQRRKLGEALGEEPQVFDRGSEEDAAANFMALEAAARKSETGTPLAADPGHARFFTEMCSGFASQGRLQMLTLEAGGELLAAKCNLLAGDTIFCLKIAFDERWAKFSPGIQLELEMIKFFHERSIAETMDSCAYSGNPMINRLWPDRRRLATQVIPTSGMLGRGAVPTIVVARKIRDQLRNGGGR